MAPLGPGTLAKRIVAHTARYPHRRNLESYQRKALSNRPGKLVLSASESMANRAPVPIIAERLPLAQECAMMEVSHGRVPGP